MCVYLLIDRDIYNHILQINIIVSHLYVSIKAGCSYYRKNVLFLTFSRLALCQTKQCLVNTNKNCNILLEKDKCFLLITMSFSYVLFQSDLRVPLDYYSPVFLTNLPPQNLSNPQ